jgi:hypothetical protein
MARTGSYCRAYHARDFAAFPGWRPDPSALRPAAEGADGGPARPSREALRNGDILYLQEDFSVTDGIFLDEHVVFADAGAEWRAFCTGALGFAPPADDGAEEAEPAAASASAEA